MSLSHMIAIGIIVLLVVPPEKLPEVMRTLGRFFNDVRRQTSDIWEDIKKDAAFKPEDIVKPSDFTMKKLLEDEPTARQDKENKTIVKAAEDDKPKPT